ncbi:polysaccharide biosynthesis/export family protein [Phenylobacterium montanum]|uniref:Polysaccharide export protein n=1 Tax=Phenylobacterium montanum TaxID=2823693 RepID=A0A975G3V8_9CAUL|nr:polysaccharide biosynthesis/export family protein [Caulobacter sp. S6]QUD89531.1 polysaccharide export protein [Caulobacter sp. S6]
MRARSALGLVMGASLICLGLRVPPAAANTSQNVAVVERQAPAMKGYRLGVGDKLRIIVFNEPNLTGEFSVNANGTISFPLIGDVPAVLQTKDDVAATITRRLADGYLRTPQVSIDVIGFRPFYILGEVNKPGEYPYEPGLTVMDAVAAAQGFTYRADKKYVFIKQEHQAAEVRDPLQARVPVHPGDTLRIGERFF